MGLFGGLGKALKNVDWDRVSTGFSAAGASAAGEHGQAAQIWGNHRKNKKDAAEEELERQQRTALVQAAIRMNVPPEQANALPTSTLAGLVGQQYQPSPMERDVAAWQRMTPQEQAAYGDLSAERAGPGLFPLPGGRTFYGRPKDIPIVLGQGGGLPPMPGPISGYGGGTWNMDGTQATPVQRGGYGGQQQDPITAEMYRGAVNGLGAQGAADWINRNGSVISVTTPQEARSLPSGTRIRLPDGTEGVVP